MQSVSPSFDLRNLRNFLEEIVEPTNQEQVNKTLTDLNHLSLIIHGNNLVSSCRWKRRFAAFQRTIDKRVRLYGPRLRQIAEAVRRIAYQIDFQWKMPLPMNLPGDVFQTIITFCCSEYDSYGERIYNLKHLAILKRVCRAFFQACERWEDRLVRQFENRTLSLSHSDFEDSGNRRYPALLEREPPFDCSFGVSSDDQQALLIRRYPLRYLYPHPIIERCLPEHNGLGIHQTAKAVEMAMRHHLEAIRPTMVFYHSLEHLSKIAAQEQYCPRVLEVVVRGSQDFKILSCFKEVIELRLTASLKSEILAGDLDYLKQLPALRCLSLELHPDAGWTDGSFQVLFELRQLEHLKVGGRSMLSPRCLDAIATLSRLKSLYLPDYALWDASIDELIQLPQLEALAFHLPLHVEPLSIESYQKLLSLQRLEVLKISDSVHLSDQAMEILLKLPALKQLSISGGKKLTPMFFNALVRCTTLERFVWVCCPHHDEEFVQQVNRLRQCVTFSLTVEFS